MTDKSPTTEPQEKLDEITEGALEAFKNAAHNCGIAHTKYDALQRETAAEDCLTSEAALRSRIRTLIEEARKTATRRLLDEALNSGDGSYKP